MEGSIKITKVSKKKKERLLIFFNQLADEGLKLLARLIAPNSSGILGYPISHCQLGIGGIGAAYPYDILSLNTGISQANNGIEPVYNAVLVHDDFTVVFTFLFNYYNTLYGYLSSIGNPEINEIGLLINYTSPASIDLFCAKDFNYGTLPFLIDNGYSYEVEYELKFGREVSSSSSL